MIAEGEILLFVQTGRVDRRGSHMGVRLAEYGECVDSGGSLLRQIAQRAELIGAAGGYDGDEAAGGVDGGEGARRGR